MPYDDYEDYEEEEYDEPEIDLGDYEDYDDSSYSAAGYDDSAGGYQDPFDPNATVNVKGMNIRGSDLLQDSYMQQDMGNEREGRSRVDINLAPIAEGAYENIIAPFKKPVEAVGSLIENIQPPTGLGPVTQGITDWTADRINDVINTSPHRQEVRQQAASDLGEILPQVNSAISGVKDQITRVPEKSNTTYQTPQVDYSDAGRAVYDAISNGAQPPSNPGTFKTPTVDYGIKYESDNPVIKGLGDAIGGASNAAVDALNSGAAGVDRLVHGKPQTTASAAEADYNTVYQGGKKPTTQSINSSAGVTKDDFARDRGPDLSAVTPGDDPYTTKYFPKGIMNDETGESTPVPAPRAGVGDAAPVTAQPLPLSGSPEARRTAPALSGQTMPSRPYNPDPGYARGEEPRSNPDPGYVRGDEPRSNPDPGYTREPASFSQNPTSLEDMIDHLMKSQSANDEVNRRAIDANSATQVSLGNASNPTPGSMNEPAFASAVNTTEANEFRGPDGRLYVEYTDDQGNKRTVPSSTWFGRNEDEEQEKKYARRFNKGTSPEQRRKNKKNS